MLQDAAKQATAVSSSTMPVILPLIRGRTIEYRKVVRTRVATRQPLGAWDVYVDAHTGRAVARENQARVSVTGIAALILMEGAAAAVSLHRAGLLF